MSFGCFSGGTQPGSVGAAPTILTAGLGFRQFSDGPRPLNTALNAATAGSIAMLWPADAGLVGIWYKRGASDLVLVGGWCDFEEAAAASVAPFNMTSDLVAKRGSNPSLGSGGLQLAADSTVAFAAAGTYGGAGWNVAAEILASESGAIAAGSYFGVGLVSALGAEGLFGLLGKSGAAWHRLWAESLDSSAKHTVSGTPGVGNRERDLDGTPYRYACHLGAWNPSQAGSTTQRGYLVTMALADHTSEQGELATPAASLTGGQTENQDQQIAFSVDSSGDTGTVSAVVVSTSLAMQTPEVIP